MAYERTVDEDTLSLDEKITLSLEKIKNMEDLVIEMEKLGEEQSDIDDVITNITSEINVYDALIAERDG